jgi:hypothetical protein
MSVKFSNFRVKLLPAPLAIFFAAFGVCSVSFDANAYPLTSSETVRFTRSSRDTPPAKPQKAVVYESQPRAPFAPGTHNLSVGIGQYFLLGTLGSNYENAIGPEIHYNYGVSDLFAFESNFGYHSHSAGSCTIWNLAAGLRSNLMYFDQLVPFATIGLGFYHPSLTYSTGGSAGALLFGLQLGGGIDLLISKQVFFGTRLTYNDMFNSTNKDSNGVTRSLGGAYLSFMLNAGITY